MVTSKSSSGEKHDNELQSDHLEDTMEENQQDYKKSVIFKKWGKTDIGRAANGSTTVAILSLLLIAQSKRQVELLAKKRLPELCQLSRKLLLEVEVLWRIMQKENERELVLEWIGDTFTEGKPHLCQYYGTELMKGKKALFLRGFPNSVPIVWYQVIGLGNNWGADINLNGIGRIDFGLYLHCEEKGDKLYADFRMNYFRLTEGMAFAISNQMPEFYINPDSEKQNDLTMAYILPRPSKSLLSFEQCGEGYSSYLKSVQLGDSFEDWLLAELQKQKIPVVALYRGKHWL